MLGHHQRAAEGGKFRELITAFTIAVVSCASVTGSLNSPLLQLYYVPALHWTALKEMSSDWGVQSGHSCWLSHLRLGTGM